jgi:hypothetical protein
MEAAMQSDTVFGHLALRFGVHPENLATEALCFILRNSPAASRAFVALTREIGLNDLNNLDFKTQQGGPEQSVFDLACYDDKGRMRVIVENKFWADLTDKQPTAYIRGLPGNLPALLMFVAPDARLQSLWNEVLDLHNKNKDAGAWANEIGMSSTRRVADIGGGHYIAAISWRNLLHALSEAATSAGETESHNNIIQLEGLCAKMDEEEFLPLRPEELEDPNMARRFLNFSSLPFDIAERAAGSGLCIKKRETHYRYGTGISIQIAGFTAWIGFGAFSWRKWGISPIWIQFFHQYCRVVEVRKRLNAFVMSTPQRCFDFEHGSGKGVAVPIILRTNVEKQQVIEDAVRQLRELKALLELPEPIDTSTDRQGDSEPDATPGCDLAGIPSDGVGTDVVLEMGAEDGS